MIIGIGLILIGIMMFASPVKSNKKDIELSVDEKRKVKLIKKITRVCAVVIVCCGMLNIIVSVIE